MRNVRDGERHIQRMADEAASRPLALRAPRPVARLETAMTWTDIVLSLVLVGGIILFVSWYGRYDH